MSDTIADGPDGLTISFDGPHGPTQLHFSNELLTGPLEPFVRKLREAEFVFDPLHVDKLREYLIAHRDGNEDVLADYEMREPKTHGAYPREVGGTSEVLPLREQSGPVTHHSGVAKAIRIRAAGRLFYEVKL